MRRRKVTKLSKNQVAKIKTEHHVHKVKCSTCDNVLSVDENVVAVKCSICTAKMVPAPTGMQKREKSDKPAGWRFMTEFVDSEGNVYHHGVEQTELKGTLPPSDVDKIKKEQKEKRKLNKEKKILRQKLKEERLAKLYEKKLRAKKREEKKLKK